MTFAFGPDVLVVSDTGGFRRCKELDEQDCPLERQNGRRPCACESEDYLDDSIR